MSTIVVKSFVAPEAKVTMSNIVINPDKYQFQMDLDITYDNGSLTSMYVTGSITRELHDWYCQMTPIKVQVKADNEKGYEWIKTGRECTRFEKFLKRCNLNFQTNDSLRELVFECRNDDPDYKENPFRLTMYENKNTLTLVNEPPKVRKATYDEHTGLVTERYFNKTFIKDGVTIKSWVSKEYYKRLIMEVSKEYEPYVPPTVSNNDVPDEVLIQTAIDTAAAEVDPGVITE